MPYVILILRGMHATCMPRGVRAQHAQTVPFVLSRRARQTLSPGRAATERKGSKKRARRLLNHLC